MTWKNRIVGHGEQAAGQFIANPGNWRIHPKAQRDALTGILGDVGWVQSVIVNKTTGNVVDGHARIEEALKLGDETPVPFVEVELSEEEEQKILLTLDPISALAAADKANLQALMDSASFDSPALNQMLADLAADAGLIMDNIADESHANEEIPSQWAIMIECSSEEEQKELLDRLVQEGVKCKALIS
jgi:ParB-like chromosome segregation protein Spo0J